MRMYGGAVIIALFAALALAQTSPIPRSDVMSGHQRHEDDEEPPPASAASVLPGTPVITIEGVCDQLSGASGLSNQAKGQAGSAAGLVGSSAAPTTAECKSIVTKAQFEKLVDALNPQMAGPVRRQLAESYPRLLLFANQARALGLDQDPTFAEMMRFASIQLLTQRLNRYFEEQASNISESDVERYYKENAIKFERAELLRIFVPQQSRPGQNPASGERSKTGTETPMLSVAEKIQARAAAGEDFAKLQKEAFEAVGIPSGSPNVSTGKISFTGVPVNHQQVFDMEPGQVSDVIADSSGYYIYKLVSKQIVPMSQVSKEIRKSIAAQRVQDSIALLTKSLKFDLNPLYFGALAGSERSRQRAVKGDKPPTN
jgi:parvulin-like peptidyl-prolyl isomerase